MSARYFIDTNVFVFSFGKQDPEKQMRSAALITNALNSGDGIISYQVIQEFLNLATRKFQSPMQLEDSLVYLKKVLNPLCHIYPDLALFELCLQIQSETHYSFYDSLILAAAISGGCDILYSEDLQDRHQNRSVKIINPFTDGDGNGNSIGA
jgi:predicted nucleic acid-binding protein